MSEIFKMTTLGAISQVVTRGKTPQYDENGSAFIVKSAQVQIQQVLWEKCPNISDEFANKHKSRFALQEGDILLNGTGTGTLGRPGFVRETPDGIFIPDSHVNLIRVNQEIAHPKYVFYWLLTPTCKGYIERGSTGSTNQIELSADRVSKIAIPLPPLEEQKRIAEVLDKADRLRQKDRQLLAKYDQLLQSVFLDMFGDPVKNEKGWEELQFAEVGKLDRGKSKHRPRNAPELLGGPYPLIQTGDVANSNRYIKSYNQTYSEIGLKQSRLWPSGTLCITIAANIAKTGILTFDACFPDSVVGFKPNEKVEAVYVQSWLSFLQKTLEENAPESAQKNINLEILRTLKIPVPPIATQKRFKFVIDKIEAIKKLQNKNLEASETLFQSLLQKAFKGELALQEAKAAVSMEEGAARVFV